MKCPYRKRLRTYSDSMGKITEEYFSDCIENSCPFWGRFSSQKVHRQEGGYVTYDSTGCRRVENECR